MTCFSCLGDCETLSLSLEWRHFTGICLVHSFFFFFFFWCSFLGMQIILSVWRLKYFFSFVKIFFTYRLSSLDCFFSFSNACFCVHYNFCIYLRSPCICSVVSVLAFLLLREIFLHLFSQASLYFSSVAVLFFGTLAVLFKMKLLFLSLGDGSPALRGTGTLLQPVFGQWLPAPAPPPHTPRARPILPYLQHWSPLATATAKSLQSCPTLCDPIPGILQARTLEWVAISFSSA